MKVEITVFELDRVTPSRITIELTRGEAEALFDGDGPRVRHEMNEKIWAALHEG